MEELDPNVEQQVWQRVMQRQEQPRGDALRELRMISLELAGCYRSLTAMLTGRGKEQAKRLYEGEKANAACLKGVGLLSGRGEEVLKLWNPGKEPPRKLLEKCYHRTRRCMTEYMARSGEPESGAVFRELADRAGRQCALIAELLGLL